MSKRSKKQAKKMKLLDRYDTEGYYRDLEYLAKLSYLPQGTRDWIESRMYELREQANTYEHKVGELLINKGVTFIHQAPFVFRSGYAKPKIYFCDFYLPDYRLVLEVDGMSHLYSGQRVIDARRDKDFKGVGIPTVRIGNEETGDPKLLGLRLSQYVKQFSRQ